ncbi:MAG: phosphohydrolase, partial [Flavobacteriales bacterium]|nr:phosphohydrolase [Flavobacteriales bacterium]
RIADDKANTLISVNAIILSIVLSALFPKMDSNPWLIYPGMALILVSISTIILATLSTIPKTTHGSVSVEDVKNKRGNLLFFGNFHSMSLSEFEFGIRELMKDGEYLYGSLTRDLYFLGIVLNRKYGLLRRAYLIFVVGLVISILLFAWSILTLPPETISTPESMDIL